MNRKIILPYLISKKQYKCNKKSPFPEINFGGTGALHSVCGSGPFEKDLNKIKTYPVRLGCTVG
jgi:hypothetical protein